LVPRTSLLGLDNPERVSFHLVIFNTLARLSDDLSDLEDSVSYNFGGALITVVLCDSARSYASVLAFIYPFYHSHIQRTCSAFSRSFTSLFYVCLLYRNATYRLAAFGSIQAMECKICPQTQAHAYSLEWKCSHIRAEKVARIQRWRFVLSQITGSMDSCFAKRLYWYDEGWIRVVGEVRSEK
jgi:hypothetical protein